MLNKNEIILGLQNKEFIVRNAMYQYVCRLHLYDDEEINEALIQFIQENYKKINYYCLEYSKLNVKIIEALMEIYLSENKLEYKEDIEDVLIEHYDLIKNLDYNFEELMTNKHDLLLYKKIKHFSKKDPEDLIERYIKNIEEYYYLDEDEDDETYYTKEVLISAMGTALIQSEEGFRLLMEYAMTLYEEMQEEDTAFIDEEMTWLVYPLCQAKKKESFFMILNLYMTNMDYIAYKDNCDFYFSSICDDEFIEYYINILKDITDESLQDYFYDICGYINSEEIDNFLLKSLKTNLSIDIKENIIRILATKFDKRVIPFALQFANNDEYFYEEEFKFDVAPMLIINNCKDKTSLEIIEYVKNMRTGEEVDKEKMVQDVMSGLQNLLYKDNEQIKEYKKTRAMFRKIMQDMVDYFEDGKFKWKIDYDKRKYNKNNTKELFTSFDNRTQEGLQALINTVAFKNACNMNCITEEFISKNKYRKKEKIEMLHSMLNSEAGLFEVTQRSLKQGTVNLRNVLNGNEFEVIDLALSSNINLTEIYMYTRIITYNDISFCSGLNIPYLKRDSFIKKWIKEKKNANNQEQEITRFLELYNEYQKNDHGVQSISRQF